MVVIRSHRNPWKAISNGIDAFKTLVRFKVGKGNKIWFWEDVWVGDSSLASHFPQLFRVTIMP